MFSDRLFICGWLGGSEDYHPPYVEPVSDLFFLGASFCQGASGCNRVLAPVRGGENEGDGLVGSGINTVMKIYLKRQTLK